MPAARNHDSLSAHAMATDTWVPPFGIIPRQTLMRGVFFMLLLLGIKCGQIKALVGNRH
jgi:hypothetical protein